MAPASEETPSGARTLAVFLSYASDDRTKAQVLVAALEADGCSVWWDRRLGGGDDFTAGIEAALEAADAVVVLWSARSVDSHWVRDEAAHGRDRGRLVPATLDGTPPPLGFRQIHAIDLAKWRGKPAAPEVAELLAAVRSVAAAPANRPVMPARVSVHPSRRGLILAGAVGAAALGGGLAAWKAGLFASAPPNSVAVLPFRNLSGDKDQDYFSDGLTEQIRSTLSRNEKLRIMAPTSTMAASEKVSGPKEIAQRLGVAFLLDGSVRRSGDLVRIVARLVDAASGMTTWSDQLDKRVSDIFALQDEIATSVAGALAAQTADLGAQMRKQLGGTKNVAAYDAYLRGEAFYALRSGEAAYRAALAQFDLAIDADPDYSEAHTSRAFLITVITKAFSRASEFKVAFESALASARRGVELAPRLALAQATLGYVLIEGKVDIRGARQPYARALELGRGDATVMNFVATYFGEIGKQEEANTAIARAIELDPLNPAAYRMAAFIAYSAHEFEQAIGHCRKALSLSPQLDMANGYIGDNLLQLGRNAEARDAYMAEPTEIYRLTGLAIAERRLGRNQAAQQAYDRLVDVLGDGATYQYALILAQWRQFDEAMAKLRFAREIGDAGIALAKTDPMLDPLRGLPEFSRLLVELGFD